MLDNYDTQKHMPSKHKKENISFIIIKSQNIPQMVKNYGIMLF